MKDLGKAGHIRFALTAKTRLFGHREDKTSVRSLGSLAVQPAIEHNVEHKMAHNLGGLQRKNQAQHSSTITTSRRSTSI